MRPNRFTRGSGAQTTRVRRKCHLTGKWKTWEMEISPEDYKRGMYMLRIWYAAHVAFPTLTESEREFILTGDSPPMPFPAGYRDSFLTT